jgi:hypothetical protein
MGFDLMSLYDEGCSYRNILFSGIDSVELHCIPVRELTAFFSHAVAVACATAKALAHTVSVGACTPLKIFMCEATTGTKWSS